MKRIRSATLADWISNVCDTEDRVSRKRMGLPPAVTAYDYHCYRPDGRPISDYEQGLAVWQKGGAIDRDA